MSAPLPDPTKPFDQQEETVLVAQCIYGEARGQNSLARTGVACSILNRLLHWREPAPGHQPEYGPRTWTGIVLHPGAYDCFVDEKNELLRPSEAQAWEECYQLAADLLNGTVKDVIERATFYFDKSRDGNPPYWAKPPVLGKLTEHVLDLGDLRFYRYKA